MPLKYTCPRCGKLHRKIDASLLGCKVQCSCGKISRLGPREDAERKRKQRKQENNRIDDATEGNIGDTLLADMPSPRIREIADSPAADVREATATGQNQVANRKTSDAPPIAPAKYPQDIFENLDKEFEDVLGQEVEQEQSLARDGRAMDPDDSPGSSKLDDSRIAEKQHLAFDLDQIKLHDEAIDKSGIEDSNEVLVDSDEHDVLEDADLVASTADTDIRVEAKDVPPEEQAEAIDPAFRDFGPPPEPHYPAEIEVPDGTTDSDQAPNRQPPVGKRNKRRGS